MSIADANLAAAEEESSPLDVLIIGAGMSGIGAGCALRQNLPAKRFAILEARENLGGTWDLFRYPGIRSDSDLYTFAYAFKPWKSRKSIAGAAEILTYMREAADENGVTGRIRFNCKVVGANWNSRTCLWEISVEDKKAGTRFVIHARWLFGATGYYDYAKGFRPTFPNEEAYQGRLIHPQDWPEDYNPAGEQIAVIGSGATAVTLIPALAETAAHVTQIQRTPSYILPIPSEEKLANLLRGRIPEKTLYRIMRWKNIRRQRWIWLLCQRYPRTMRKLIAWANRKSLPEGFAVDTHFNPPYSPWDQRLCAVPDGDFFTVLSDGRASIVTGAIETFFETGIRMQDGTQVAADTIVTATGLNLQLFGGAEIRVDDRPIVPSERVVFKGTMLDGVPNFCFAVGYTNSSWTLKIGLLCDFFVQLLQEMDARGKQVCFVERPSDLGETRPLLDFAAGYVKRSLDTLPRQGRHAPWQMSFSYMEDAKALRRGPVLDPAMRLSEAPAADSALLQQSAAE